MKVSRRRLTPLPWLLLAGLLSSVGSSCADPATWRSLDSGLELRRLASEGDAPALTLIRRPADGPARLRVRRSDEGLLVSDLAAEAGVLAAVNANFFDVDGRPLGWVVSDGRESSALGTAGWGVLLVVGGEASIRRPAAVEPEPSVRQAVQAGPILVEAGRPNPGLKAQSARRVFVGLDAAGRLVLGSSGIARADAKDLAARLARPESEGGAGLVEVLNLDGGSSAQLYLRGGLGEADLLEPGLVRVPVVLTLETID